MENHRQIYTRTTLLESKYLSSKKLKVFLKLENTQPSGSFKIRGISNLIQKELQKGCTRLVASSAGNAGMAAAYTAHLLQVPITIFVPTTTATFMVDKIRAEGATVIQHGAHWKEANVQAIKLSKEEGYSLIHPFDHHDIWEGNSTVVDEIHSELNERGISKPDLVVLSIGGGGLFCGVVQGMERCGWAEVPILAMETEGAASFNASVKAGKLVTLTEMTSVAKTLGAVRVADQAFQYYLSRRNVISEVVTDKESVHACLRFANDQRMLLETSCGASLAALYSDVVTKLMFPSVSALEDRTTKTIVVIVCGGNAVDLDEIQRLKNMFDL